MTWIPTLNYVLALFEEQIEKPVLMNRTGLESTLDKVKWGNLFQGSPTLWDQVTILYMEVVQNHYFVNGNKRIGSLLAYIFLAKNSKEFSPPAGEVFSVTMAIAQGQKTFEEIRKWFRLNSN